MIIIEFIVAMFATISFAILFNAPKKEVFYCGFTGAFGWIVYYLMTQNNFTSVLASLTGAVLPLPKTTARSSSPKAIAPTVINITLFFFIPFFCFHKINPRTAVLIVTHLIIISGSCKCLF